MTFYMKQPLNDEVSKPLSIFAKKNNISTRGGKSSRFREFNSQKIFSQTMFGRIHFEKHHGIEWNGMECVAWAHCLFACR